MENLDEKFESWWNTWKPLNVGKDHAKAAFFAGVHAANEKAKSDSGQKYNDGYPPGFGIDI